MGNYEVIVVEVGSEDQRQWLVAVGDGSGKSRLVATCTSSMHAAAVAQGLKGLARLEDWTFFDAQS